MAADPIALPIDYVVFNKNHKTPGLCEIVGAGSPRDYEEIRGPYASGARLRFRGRKLSQFELKIRLYTSEDFAEWAVLLPLLLSAPKGPKPSALQAYHPFLEDLGIAAVVVEDVSAPMQTDDGEWTVSVKLHEHREIRYALAKIVGSDVPQDDPVERRIEELTGQVQDLAGDINSPVRLFD